MNDDITYYTFRLSFLTNPGNAGLNLTTALSKNNQGYLREMRIVVVGFDTVNNVGISSWAALNLFQVTGNVINGAIQGTGSTVLDSGVFFSCNDAAPWYGKAALPWASQLALNMTYGPTTIPWDTPAYQFTLYVSIGMSYN